MAGRPKIPNPRNRLLAVKTTDYTWALYKVMSSLEGLGGAVIEDAIMSLVKNHPKREHIEQMAKALVEKEVEKMIDEANSKIIDLSALRDGNAPE